jgi:hypothetical protein
MAGLLARPGRDSPSSCHSRSRRLSGIQEKKAHPDLQHIQKQIALSWVIFFNQSYFSIAYSISSAVSLLK